MSENVYEGSGCIVTYFAGPAEIGRMVQFNAWNPKTEDWEWVQMRRFDWEDMIKALSVPSDSMQEAFNSGDGSYHP